jgi:hypothetical protein
MQQIFATDWINDIITAVRSQSRPFIKKCLCFSEGAILNIVGTEQNSFGKVVMNGYDYEEFGALGVENL